MNLPILILALMTVESNHDPYAIGDNGDAHGILQIHECVVIDVNARYDLTYTHNDMFDPDIAVEVCKKYLEMYATERRLGREPTAEDYAKCWNSGPNFFRKTGKAKENAEAYWQKVRAVL